MTGAASITGALLVVLRYVQPLVPCDVGSLGRILLTSDALRGSLTSVGSLIFRRVIEGSCL